MLAPSRRWLQPATPLNLLGPIMVMKRPREANGAVEAISTLSAGESPTCHHHQLGVRLIGSIDVAENSEMASRISRAASTVFDIGNREVMPLTLIA
jgi:hypothetical protein